MKELSNDAKTELTSAINYLIRSGGKVPRLDLSVDTLRANVYWAGPVLRVDIKEAK